MRRTALITGVTGQDGTYLSEHLLRMGYRVHGTTRDVQAARAKLPSSLADRLGSDFLLHSAKLSDPKGLAGLFGEVAPDEVYHLAAQSHIGVSFERPFETLDANAGGSLAVLEAARRLAARKAVRVFQACSSELFGNPDETPQRETTRMAPRNPYGCAKLAAFHLAKNYRDQHGLFVSNGILYNHESPRRHPGYVTRKISLAAAEIAAGVRQTFSLGSLDVGRDWGFAGDYVVAIHRMLQVEAGDDFVLATGWWHSLKDFLDIAFGTVGLDWRAHLVHDPALVRPPELARLVGDPSKAHSILDWAPGTDFEALVSMMVTADRDRVGRDRVGRDRVGRDRVGSDRGDSGLVATLDEEGAS